MAARCHAALGAIDAAREYYRRSLEMIRRCSGPSVQALQVAAAFAEVFAIIGEGEDLAELGEITALAQPGGENTWATAVIRATLAGRAAGSGDRAAALAMLRQVLPAIELAPVGAPLYPMLVFHAARALWLLNASELADVIAANTHAKVIEPDFRFINHDGRLTLARLLAIQSRHDEASRWFAEARRRAKEGGELPWHAIADFDEAIMLARRDHVGDGDRARPLIQSALLQFREIGMTGWLQRAELLAQQLN
jgi:hypothetical protein